MNEIWKDVTNFEGLYQVSNLGNVRNRHGRILKPHYYNNYYSVSLSKHGIQKYYRIHRLVALAFIENDDAENKTTINHKDENKLNNKADNLEWLTQKDNCNYGTRNMKISIANTLNAVTRINENTRHKMSISAKKRCARKKEVNATNYIS